MNEDHQRFGLNPESVLTEIVSYLQPRPCGHKLIRIGGDKDGAYLLPDDLEGIKWCISPGVNNFKYFEDQLLELYGVKSILVDYTSDPQLFATPLQEGKQIFYKKWLAAKSNLEQMQVSLQDLINENCEKGDDLILQMDIEGAEWDVLSSCPESLLSDFRIIVLELHDLDKLDKANFASNIVLPNLRKISQTHSCVHIHPNNTSFVKDYGNGQPLIPSMVEVTFLRRDRIRQGGEVVIPHFLDIINNETMSSIALGKPWVTDSSSLAATVGKIRLEMHDKDLDFISLHQRIETLRHGMEKLLELQLSSLSTGTVDPQHSYLQQDRHDEVDVAQDCSISFSSRLQPFDLGIEKVTEFRPFFFHTCIEDNPWLMIDLGRPVEVTALEIGNRTDSCQARARCLSLVLMDDNQLPILPSAIPLLESAAFLSGKKSIHRTNLPRLRARFLKISAQDTALHFSSIRVLSPSHQS
ncbi:conserved hypothetical protein [Cyanobium sp. PCC 7001]|uniref:FkbM family methyltransferase n=1 Tax=Cyanobium sp. PCC 7001 TaxID=180281 RepID=UPI000180585E|nr:FkbM family methyltransferase [Cyanobium sp. PCC 7001]EDY38064.1 conserved hypothetical protein [Cyanobium sp. PCC 7001]